MGCGASQAVNPVESITQAPEPTQRAENDGHGHKAWERAVFAANAQWTAHSTSAVAKHAMAQGLPEPPESFFTTQERLVSFFYSEGAQQTFAPNELVMDAGTETGAIYLIEEGSVAMQKDVKVKRRTMTSTKGHRFGKSEGTAHSDIMAEKMNDKNQFNGVEQDEGEGEDGGCGNFGSSIAESEPASPLRRVTIDEGAIRESAEAVVDTVQLTILEENELVGEVAFMESSALGERFVAGGEGCAMRMISREAFLAELRRDPEFAGNVFKNLALTLSVKCEEINWRLEEMATEASSMSWRASWRIDSNSTHKQQYAVSASEAKKLRQLFEIPDEEDLSHSTTATFGYNSVRVNGHFLAFAKHLCFYSRVFGMQVRKCIPTESLVSVLRDTPATKGMENAIEVASLDETLILSSIPDIEETCEVINEILAIAKRVARGSSVQRLELLQVVANEDETPSDPSSGDGRASSHRSGGTDTFGQDFTLNPEDWLVFLRDNAELRKYKSDEVIIDQGGEADCLYFIFSGSGRVEKKTSLGDGTVVISRLPPQSIFGVFFFLMGVPVRSLTSLICDSEQAEVYVVKASSVAEAAKTTPELPAQLYKYLAVSMARKYRVLATTAGYGLQRSDAGVDPVDVEEVFGNPVFLSFYARFLRQEKPEKFPWFQAYTEIEEFRVMPIGEAATARGRQLYKKYVLPGSPDALAFLSQDNQLTTAEALAPDPSTDGGDDESYLAPEVFDMTIEEIKEELRLHTYDKFVASSHFAGVHELKCREKEVPTADHFYFLHQLGVGSFGEVYAVRKKDSQRRYAMKVMAKASQAQMSKRWAMYIRIECDVMASLFHPSLVNLNYCFQTPEAVFMVLDLVVGGDLEGFQTNFVHGPPTQAMVCFMAAELVSGFEYMHSQSVIHRDMKPPNVLIGSDGHLRIADFGLSLKLKPGEVLFDRTGTKPYMSPELHVSSRSARRGYSFAADWYALGVTLYEICNGGLDLPSSVQHTLAGLEEHKRALPSSFLFKDMRIEDFTGNMANLDPASKRFLADLLKANPAARPDSRSIKKHKFFATVNWAALDARRVQIPWTEAQMAVLVTKQLDENVAMRKTAKETLQHVYEMEKLEPVSKFDFVSPRAVMEEYLENIYQLRSVDERNII